MEPEPDYHFDHNPPPEACRGSLEGYLGYQVTTSTFGPDTIVPFRLSTPVDGQISSPILYFGGPSQGYLPSTEDFGYGGTCQSPSLPGAAFPESIGTSSGVSGYDASSLGSWSPITPATPVGDGLTGRFTSAPGAFFFAGSLSASPPTGTTLSGASWAGSYAASDYIQAGPQARLPPSPVGLIPTPPLHEELYPLSVSSAAPAKAGRAQETMGGVLLGDSDEPTAHSRGEGVGHRKDGLTRDTSKISSKRGSSTSEEHPTQALRPSYTLRTATRKHRQIGPTNKPGESAQELRARTCHNQVEKDYRNRLHGSFEKLLGVLPEQGTRSEHNDGTLILRSASGKAKRVSKAEVLEKARLRLQFLKDDNSKRKREIAELEKKLERANDRGR